MKMKISYILKMIIFSSAVMFAQHRGDQFFMQGVTGTPEVSARALARGGAFSADYGDINALFYNPAGLSDIKDNKIMIFANRDFSLIRENQDYRPSTYMGMLSLYLEGYYVPNPKYSGGDDMTIVQNDSTWALTDPKFGQDPYSKEAAAWQKTYSKIMPINAAIAIPITNDISIAASYFKNPIFDYDGNITYLTPHPGYSFYNPLSQANSLNPISMQWYRFSRLRTGDMQTITAGLSYKIDNDIRIGVKGNYITGKSDDYIGLNKFGVLDLLGGNSFGFTYEKFKDTSYGTSKYKSLQLSAGAIYTINNFNLGVVINLPYTLQRDWESIRKINWKPNRDSLITSSLSGVDKMKVPFSYTFGLKFNAKKSLAIALDIDYKPLGDATYEFGKVDTFYQRMVNQVIVRTGIEVTVSKGIVVSLGYRNTPEAFLPDGAAIKDHGPVTTSYTIGASYATWLGRVDAVYEFSKLKYYDSYYTNTNYNTLLNDKFSVSYLLTF